VTNIAAVMGGFATIMSWVVLPAFIQTPRGLRHDVAALATYGFDASATKTALYMLPAPLVGFVAGPICGRIARRHGPKLALEIGLVFTALGPAVLAVYHDRPWHIAVGMFLAGLGAPMSVAAGAMMIVDSVPHEETAVAAAIFTVLRTIGGVIGAQVGAAILASIVVEGTQLPRESAFVAIFWVATAVAVAGVLVALPATDPSARDADAPPAEEVRALT
jgi:MFS family permease